MNGLERSGGGADRARTAGARSVCVVLYGSEGMALASVGMSRDEVEGMAERILQQARRLTGTAPDGRARGWLERRYPGDS